MIDSYSFGSIVINGKTYTSDVIVFPDKVQDLWWRKKGHLLQIDDLYSILSYQPHILIIGTGAYGLMKIPEETREFISNKGIKLYSDKTAKACTFYNTMKKKKLVAAFHITC